MKTIAIFLLSAAFLPHVLRAQPTVAFNEYYDAGTVINVINVDPSSINAGDSGSNISWDLSHATADGTSATIKIDHNPGTIYPTSNIIVTLPGGNLQYMSENSTDTYLDEFIDRATGDTITYTFLDVSKRPMTYQSYYRDSYRVASAIPLITGHGIITISGDAWGTLKTPTGTYRNVLRIKKKRVETDTVGGAYEALTIITYQWFSETQKAPLFEIDSTISVSGSNVKAMYLTNSLAVQQTAGAEGAFTGYLVDDQLNIRGNFESGKTYNVAVYSVIGNKIYNGDFTAGGQVQHVDIGRDLSPGIYMVALAEPGTPSFKEAIKIVKQ